MENKPLNEWVRENLVFHHQSGVVICRRCETPECFRSLNLLRNHLREKHCYVSAVGVAIVNEILLSSGLVKDISPRVWSPSGSFLLPPTKMPKCLDGLLLKKQQKQYWDAPESLSAKVQSLPAIPLLPITLGFQCPSPDCFQSYPRLDSLRTHIYKQHQKRYSVNSENVKLQSLSSHENKRKYFPVHQLPSQVGSQFVLLSHSASESPGRAVQHQNPDAPTPCEENTATAPCVPKQPSASGVSIGVDEMEAVVRERNLISESEVAKSMGEDGKLTNRDAFQPDVLNIINLPAHVGILMMYDRKFY